MSRRCVYDFIATVTFCVDGTWACFDECGGEGEPVNSKKMVGNSSKVNLDREFTCRWDHTLHFLYLFQCMG